MDEWQKNLYERLKEFIGDVVVKSINEESVRLEINEAEAYVLIKALEAQEKFEHPSLLVEPSTIIPELK